MTSNVNDGAPCEEPRAVQSLLCSPGSCKMPGRSPEEVSSVPVGRRAPPPQPRALGAVVVFRGQLRGHRRPHVTVPCPDLAIPATAGTPTRRARRVRSWRPLSVS